MIWQRRRNDKGGFTMIELMLAMAFFSFIMMFVLAGFLQISRSYVRGVTVKKVHESGRELLEQITRDIRVLRDAEEFQATQNGSGSQRSFCFEGAYELVYYQAPPPPATPTNEQNQLYVENNPLACDVNADTSASEKLVDREELAVQFFSIERVENTNIFEIVLALSTGDYSTDLLDQSTIGTSNVACEPGKSGSQYCDVVVLRETVTLRNE